MLSITYVRTYVCRFSLQIKLFESMRCPELKSVVRVNFSSLHPLLGLFVYYHTVHYAVKSTGVRQKCVERNGFPPLLSY